MSGWGSGTSAGWGGADGTSGNDDGAWGPGSNSSSTSSGWGPSPVSGSTSAGWGDANSPAAGTQTGGGGWDPQQSRETSGGVITAPLLWLGLGLAVVVLAAALWFVNDGVPLAVVGWLLAGPIAIGFWALFLIKDSRRRAGAWYAPSAATRPLTLLLVTTALVVVALHAYHVADTVSRSGS